MMSLTRKLRARAVEGEFVAKQRILGSVVACSGTWWQGLCRKDRVVAGAEAGPVAPAELSVGWRSQSPVFCAPDPHLALTFTLGRVDLNPRLSVSSASSSCSPWAVP